MPDTEIIPTSTGEETLEERIKKLEDMNKGLYQETQHERALRHQTEERLKLVEGSLEQAGDDDEKPEVAEARNFVKGVLQEELKPLSTAVSQLVVNQKIEQALDYLSEQAGMSKSKFRKEYEPSLENILRERNLLGIDPYVGILNAWEIHQNSLKEKEKSEEERERRISGSQPETTRTPMDSRSLPRRIKASKLAGLSDDEFDKINQGIKEGRIEVDQDEAKYINPNT